MSSLPRVQIKRLLAEFVVIVVGVLVALAADEWMEEREVAKAERAYLEAVDEELWALIGNWDFGRRLAADRARDLRAFEEELAMGASPDTTAGFSTDLAYVMRGTSLISSAGDVDGPILDRNPELRSALLQLASRADEAARAHGLQLGAQMSISSELDHAFSDVSAGQPVADLLREMRKFPQEARPYVRRMRRIHLNQDGRLGTLASNAEQIAERIGRILGTYQAEQVVMDGVLGTYSVPSQNMEFSIVAEQQRLYIDVGGRIGNESSRLRPTRAWEFAVLSLPGARLRFEPGDDGTVDGGTAYPSTGDTVRFHRK